MPASDRPVGECDDLIDEAVHLKRGGLSSGRLVSRAERDGDFLGSTYAIRRLTKQGVGHVQVDVNLVDVADELIYLRQSRAVEQRVAGSGRVVRRRQQSAPRRDLAQRFLRVRGTLLDRLFQGDHPRLKRHSHLHLLRPSRADAPPTVATLPLVFD